MHKYMPGSGERTMTRDEVRAVDAWAINEIGVPGVVLMENAGRSCAEIILERWSQSRRQKVVIFCGTGNNGGDGYVIARHLFNNACDVSVLICGDEGKIHGDARTNLEILSRMGLTPTGLPVGQPGLAADIARLAAGCDTIVDAVFGTGLSKTLRADYVQLIEAMNDIDAGVVAVDIPSGLDCDAGMPIPVAVRAELTVTFVAAKRGFEKPQAAAYTGEVWVAAIGIEPA